MYEMEGPRVAWLCSPAAVAAGFPAAPPGSRGPAPHRSLVPARIVGCPAFPAFRDFPRMARLQW